MERVVFAPGETCRAVTVPTVGNTTASTTPSALYKVSVTNTSNAVMGASAFRNLTVREDDGVTAPARALPPVGKQGDVCAERAAALAPVTLGSSARTVLRGGSVLLTGTGFRPGEAVTFRSGTTVIDTAVAGASGAVAGTLQVPADADLGALAVSALGAGSGREARGTVTVVAPTPQLALKSGSMVKVTGSWKVGRTITANPGTWTASGVTFSYKWSRNGTAIAGATKATYTPTSKDVGQRMTVTVTGKKTGYTSGTATGLSGRIYK